MTSDPKSKPYYPGMTLMPGESAHIEIPLPVGLPAGGRFVDVSAEVFGKYQFCTMHAGKWYADDDFGLAGPKWGAIPAPHERDRRPWRGQIVQWFRSFRAPVES